MLSLKRDGRDSYLVLCDHKMVGMIYRAIKPPPDNWRWSVDSRYEVTGAQSDGWARSLDEAKAAFKAAWGNARKA